RALGGRRRHCRKPVRDTASNRHIRLTAYSSRCCSIQAYLTATPSRNTPPLFLRFRDPAWHWPVHGAAAHSRLPLPTPDALPRPLRSRSKPTHLPDCVEPSWSPSIVEFLAAWLPHSRPSTALTSLPPS